MPRNGTTSVFDIKGLSHAAIETIGDSVGAARGKPPKGRGEFGYSDVEGAGLQFDRDDSPPRHGNLVGWPREGPELKARIKAIAVDLASRADLVLRESPS